MSTTTTLINRNRQFASDFAAADLPVLPKLRAVVLTCGDARGFPKLATPQLAHENPAWVLDAEKRQLHLLQTRSGRS